MRLLFVIAMLCGLGCTGEFGTLPGDDTGSTVDADVADTSDSGDAGSDAASDTASGTDAATDDASADAADDTANDTATDATDAAMDAADRTPPGPLTGIFVATDGDDGNDGSSEATALRTIVAGVALAMAGDTVFVKAGDYGAEEISFPRSGTEGAPITIEGYRVRPGDRPTHPDFDHETALDPALMPLLRGDRAVGTAFTAGGRAFITVRNFQITGYTAGYYAYRGTDQVVEDLYLRTFGENDVAAYSGKGIIFGSFAERNIVRRCEVVNAGAEGIMFYGDDNRAEDCKVYGSADGGANDNPPDYYMMIKGDRNVITRCEVHRVGDLEHGGHGIGIKGNGTDNEISESLATGFSGSPFYARHRGVVGNRFLNNTARDGGLGMTFRDGATGNVCEGFTAERTNGGVVFFDTTEDEGRQFSGRDNIVRNSTFTDVNRAIWLHDYTFDDVVASGNIVEGITVRGAGYLFDVRSRGMSNTLRDSEIHDVPNFAYVENGYGDSDHGFAITGCTGMGNGFEL